MSCLVEGGVKRKTRKGHRNWDFVLDVAVCAWKYQTWIIWPSLSV